MRRDTEQKIARRLRQWAKLRAEKGRIEAERDQSLEPIRLRFERQCAPIVSAANEQLEPIAQKLAQLEEEITNRFLAAVEVGGDTSFRYVDTSTAVAEVVTRSERELDAKTFFDSVPASERTHVFWSCLKTLITSAEKFLGAKRLNELARLKHKRSVVITAKYPNLSNT